MARKPRKNKSPKNDPLTDWMAADELPRAGLADAHKFERRARTYRVIVWSTVVLAPLALLALFTQGSSQPILSGGGGDLNPAGKTTAVQAVNTWLSSEPPPVPGGVVLSWDGITDLGSDNASNLRGTTRRLEIHHFTIVDENEITYAVDVEIAVDPRGGAVVVGQPSLLPITQAATDGWDNGNTWPGLSKASSTDSTKQAVDAWATAFISGDSNTLRLAVGDPDNDSFYTPLSGATAVEATIIDAAWKSDSTMLVRVELAINWLNHAPAVETSDPSSPTGSVDPFNPTNPTSPTSTSTPPRSSNAPVSTYDLLVERAATASPVVTAWGGPGSGPSLVRYGNASDGAGRTVPSVAVTTTTMAPAIPVTPRGGD